MSTQNQINCPNCGTSIDVQDILSHQLEKELKVKYEAQLAQQKSLFQKENEKLEKEREEFEMKKRRENELFREKLDKQLKEEAKLLQEKMRRKISEENSDLIKGLQDELNEKSTQVKELNRSKAEIERLKREKNEIKEMIEAENQKKLNEMLQMEKEKIKRSTEEQNELKLRELEKKLEDQKKLTEEMKRKQEQGSMQMQGEIQELAIEEWLESQFPLDSIEEVKKGARGGDCIQIVNTRARQNCGKIYYESKRTKEFRAGWIEKFKADMMEKDADLGILVTEAMPSEMTRMGLHEGIWVCSYEEFKGLCSVLRESVIQLSNALCSQENKGDKMHMLYDFLTSNTFKMQVEAIVEGFTSMKSELDREKRAMQRIWKEREKQIDKVVSNTIDMYGSIKGIAGSAIQPVKALEIELGEEDEGQLKQIG